MDHGRVKMCFFPEENADFFHAGPPRGGVFKKF